MPAPADDEIRPALVLERAGIAQDAEDRVGDACRVVEIEARDDLVVRIDDVAQHREQVLLDAPDHLAVDEGAARGVLHLELDAPGLAHDPELEVLVGLENEAGIVDQRP